MGSHLYRRGWVIASVIVLTITTCVICVAKHYVSKRTKALYDDLITNHRISDLDALVSCFAEHQFSYMDICPPGPDSWDQSAGPLPVDWEYFPDELTTNLIGYWEGTIPAYRIYVFQDQQTREITILNSDEDEINRLIRVRQVAVSGELSVLHADADLYIQKRAGGTKYGSVLVMNDSLSSSNTSVQTQWTDTTLVDLVETNSPDEVTTDGSGYATLGAPAQGYRIYAPTNALSEVNN